MDTPTPVGYGRRVKSRLSSLVSSRVPSEGARVLCLLLVAAGCATPPGNPGDGPVTLRDQSSHPAFSGARHEAYDKVFRGWHEPQFPGKEWKVEGAVLQSLEGPDVDLITRDQFESFVLDVDWKVSRGANSGILYGVAEETERTFWSGPEYQINDDPHHDDGKVPVTSAGALYDLLPPNDRKHLQPTGDWNHSRIVSRHGRIEHWLNGEMILEYHWNDPAMRRLIQQSKFKDSPLFMKTLNGHLALQHHGADVWFWNISITRL